MGKKPARISAKAVREELRQLEAQVRHHQRLYYIKNAPEISDYDFDQLYKKLEELEKAHPELASSHSPTRTVGSDVTDDFPRFEHTIPVLSLGNTYSTEEALSWAQRIQAEYPDVRFLIQWKIDGATLVCYYRQGQLERAVTRGTGQVGDDVTNNARTIADIPHVLQEKVDLVVRGEVYMHFQDFEEFNELTGNRYANPRNLTAGSLKQKNTRETALRPLRYVAFDGFMNDPVPDDQAMQKRMAELGLTVFADQLFVAPNRLAATIQKLEEKRESIPYPVDGLVLKVTSYSIREAMGYTAASPRWATALKFKPDTAETRILNIDVAVGRTGRVTPRAVLEPVRLAGTTVQHATLHNVDYIRKLGARPGARVLISKRGEIIPAVEAVLDPGPGPDFVFPEHCPACSGPLMRDADMADFLCTNRDCPERVVAGLIFFCGRKQMDIAGLGEKSVELLFQKGFIRRIPDIYHLEEKRAELEELEGLGKKSVSLMLEGIAASKKQPFRRVLPALGLRDLGPAVTEILIQAGYSDIDSMLELVRNPEAESILGSIHGIGPETSGAIREQLTDPRVLALIADLRKIGLQLAAEMRPQTTLPQIFSGESWCVTGSFEHYKPREKAMEEIKARGGRVVSSVSKATNLLLAGENAGSKRVKAEELGVAIVSETEFRNRLGS